MRKRDDIPRSGRNGAGDDERRASMRLRILIACALAAGAVAPAGATAASYRVQWGDTLSGIAAAHGMSTTRLAHLNGLRINGVLLAGSVLRVPTPGGRVAASSSGWSGSYTVRWGDTLSGIAAANGTSLTRLAHANGLQPYGILVAGTVLRTPGSAAAPRPVSGKHTARPAASAGCGSVRCTLDRWSAYYGVDRHLVRAVSWQESGWNPRMVSVAGARGAMQVLPSTRDYVERYLIGHRVNRSASGDIRVGVAYLHHLLQA